MAKTRARTGFTPKLISVAVAACFATSAAFANPTGPTVVNGTASFQQTANLLQISNSPNAIINWQSFSIGASEITRFLQQSASSAVLNRVIAQNPSSILGALQSNGRVFLINPNGILFGAGAQIDVAGLVASTLNLSNADYLAGKLKFTEVPGAGSVVNQGNIATPQGGQVYLVGPSVTNSGVITSPKGEVILAAGNSVELVNPGTPNLRVEISAPDNQAINLGQIVADSGRVGIYAGLINHSGTIRADSAQVTEDGKIILAATRNATLEAGSVTTANGAKGGSITVQSGDTTLVAGTIEAKGSERAGGTVQALGNLVGLIDNASINASGETGGGTVLVGGDFQGRNPEVQNAFRTYVGPNATITADAVTNGDGGKVIVWSDDATRAYGTISARGGAQSGNGGFVEVSGKNHLDFRARVDTSAANGRSGTLLLDDADVEIGDFSGGDGFFSGGDPNIFGNGVESSQIDWSNIRDNLVNADVIITTSGTDGFGNISIVSSSPDLATSHFLQLVAHMDITSVGVSITNSGTGDVRLYAGWNGANPVSPTVVTGTGDINLNSASIETGGNILLKAGRDIFLRNSLLWAVYSAAGPVDRSVTLHAVGGSISLVDDTDIKVEGGPGGNATASLTAANGIGLFDDCGECGAGTIRAYGGNGDLGAAGGNATVTLNNTSGLIDIKNGSNINAFGGGGGGGASSGGAGGNATVTLNNTNGSITVQGSSLRAFGGGGGGGGSGGSAGFPASIAGAGGGGTGGSTPDTGGNGGNATATLSAGGSISLTSSTINVRGGGGGGGGSSADTGGAGGNGGNATATLSAGGNISLTSSSLNVGAGGGGGGGFGSSIGGNGGNGGNATATLTAGGSISLSSISSINVGGGGGGGGAGGSFSGGSGGAGGVLIGGGGGTGGSGSSADTGGAGGNGGTATAALSAGGNISLTSSSINVGGGGGGGGGFGSSTGGNGGIGGAASASLTAGGTISLNPSTIDVIAGVGGDGGEGGGNGAVGGAASVSLSAGSGIILTSSEIFADGGEGGFGGFGFPPGMDAGGGNAFVALTTGGNITLGSSVNAEGGFGSPPGTGRIDLTFLNASGTYSVTGVTAPVPPAIGFDGFFVNGAPAVLEVNFFVTVPPSAPPLPNLIDQVVVANNMNIDILSDQLRGGEAGEGAPDDKKRELPVCR